MTIYDTIVNTYYNNSYECMEDIAKNINKEILDLQECGCKHIQLDEPVYARYPEKVTEYQSGKKGLIGLFMGEVMQLSKGKADPKLANQLLKIELEK